MKGNSFILNKRKNRKGQAAAITGIFGTIVLIIILGMLIVVFGKAVASQRDSNVKLINTGNVTSANFTEAQIINAWLTTKLLYLNDNVGNNSDYFQINGITGSNNGTGLIGTGNLTINVTGMNQALGAISLKNSTRLLNGFNFNYTADYYGDDSKISQSVLGGLKEGANNMSTLMIVSIVSLIIALVVGLLFFLGGRIGTF